MRRFLCTAFQPTVRWLDATAIVIAPVARALWGDVVTDEAIAIYIIYFVGAALALRVVSAPYLIWQEDQAIIDGLQNEVERPERERIVQRKIRHDLQREELWDCAATLLNKTRDTILKHGTPDEDTRRTMFAEWHSERANLSEKTDRFLNEERIYLAAQDLINRCDIVITEAQQHGEPFNYIKDAVEKARELKRELDK